MKRYLFVVTINLPRISFNRKILTYAFDYSDALNKVSDFIHDYRLSHVNARVEIHYNLTICSTLETKFL